MLRHFLSCARITGLAFLALLLASVALAAGPETRYHEFTKKFASTRDQAKVVAASCLGGSGTEWLVGGGFQPDGTIVVAGVTLGPTLDLGKVRTTVLGKDFPAPPAPERKHRMDKGKPAVDKAGKPIYEPFVWNHDNATGFVVRLAGNLQEIKSVSRFPWQAAGLTSAAVDGRGNIYLSGPSRAGLKNLGGEQEDLPGSDSGLKNGSCDKIYVCKLAPDASKVVWVRTLAGPSDAPEISLDKSGNLRLQSADLRTLTADGRQEKLIIIPGGITTRMGNPTTRTVACNPLDGTFAQGGEHHWRTGREPYRDPVLNIHKPDGTLLYELYNWDGPFVGLDNLRLVSDSAVRLVRYDEEGNLWLYAWSDGGNSVMYREPNDIHKVSKKMGGLGMSAWGAGVLSCAYLIKIETKNYKVVGGTLWLAYLAERNKPNSIWIDSLGFAGDGSLCFGGHSAWGLIQTGNALGGNPTGNYVAVLSKDCTSLRFCSTLPACAAVDVRNGNRWGVVSGQLNGKPVALFLGSAVEKEELAGKSVPAPGVKPLQPNFGGGHTDGYLLLLDLSAGGK